MSCISRHSPAAGMGGAGPLALFLCSDHTPRQSARNRCRLRRCAQPSRPHTPPDVSCARLLFSGAEALRLSHTVLNLS